MTYVLDIEGTTTSIAFVYDTLFPYVRAHLVTYLERELATHSLGQVVTALREQAEADQGSGADAPLIASPDATPQALLESIAANVLWQMDSDRKTTALKLLQGMIWEDGYRTGALEGHVYPDVPPALRRWAERGDAAWIYSSGSVAAQKLLFGASEAGNLLPWIAGHFDTTTGPKKDAESYRTIANAVGSRPSALTFVTDSLDEARAARAAGCEVRVSIRPGNPPLPPHDFTTITTFDSLP
jgi:2,3-diketo-5-methylthio-1-phosphopentane phosphatase